MRVIIVPLLGGIVMCAANATRGENLVENSSFETIGDDGLPVGCGTWAPWEDIEPEFGVDRSVARTGKRSLRISGVGKTGCYGYWGVQLAGLSPGKFYRVSVFARAKGAPHIDRNVGVKLSWFGPGENNELFHGRRGWQHVGRVRSEGRWHRFEREVWTPEGADSLRVELTLRWAPHATVWFDDLEVVEVPAPTPRPVRLWVAGFRRRDRTPMGAAKFWAEKIDAAGQAGADLIVCPEYAATDYDDPIELLKCSSPVPGPAIDVIAAKAKAHDTFVVYNLLENDNNVLYNTSVLIDRRGRIVGKYRKVHLA
ncbi:MAG: nitrilase-related carbon-nitrogen hydrolase, partial [Armatimonadota bacterium]